MSETQGNFPTRFVVKRGVYGSLSAYHERLEGHGRRKAFARFSMSRPSGAEEVLERISWSQDRGEEELVLVHDVRDLGFDEWYSLDDLLAAAARFGLYRLDADVAAGLFEQCSDLPECEYAALEIVMDPVEIPGVMPGCAAMLAIISNDDVLLLRTHAKDYRKRKMGVGSYWILSRRKPASAT